jgi:NhaP-type Na+/H+ or K+/H+ antiporter
LFKHGKFLTVNAVTETFLMFALGLTGYFIAEMIVIAGNPMSGVMALLTCSIINSHYTWYNLSPQGKSTSTVTIAFMGTFCEASVYSYVGIALYSSIPTWWSFSFIGILFGIVVVFRLVAIFSVFYLGRLCCRRKTISCRELTFISYAGMIRGAIAFALVLEIPYCKYDDYETHTVCDCVTDNSCLERQAYELFVTSTLALVILTTLIFGTFMSMV